MQTPANNQGQENNNTEEKADNVVSALQNRPGPQAIPAYTGRPAGGYGYGSYNYGAAASAAVSTGSNPASNSRRLVIGEGITLSGEIEACDTLVVEGTVEAALKGASVLEIAESGMFYGSVEISDCTIAGRFEGDLKVNGRLYIRSTGSVTGTFAYKELAVEAGATVEGKLTALNAPARAESARPGKPKTAAANKPSSGELPFGNKATAE
ncbi:MAG: polymer-forming cytoskeletal protein [Alphaproteobacteria bacterium]|nr:polymer-forming cytoskeletal protein [Alphaproteobacteria bacterium]